MTAKNNVDKFMQALLSIDRLGAKKIMADAGADNGQFQLVGRLVIPALECIGNGWVEGQISLSEVYMSGIICEELLKTELQAEMPLKEKQPTIAITTLIDYHILGKMFVLAMLRSAGFEVKDYGRTLVDDLVRRIIEDKVQILLISALMLPSALRVRGVREKLNEVGLNTKIVVGGAPFLFDKQLWNEVGADAMGASASDVVEIIKKLSET